MLIASFIKRFSRLCLQAPPQDIIILSAFIKNLLIRHPTLKTLIHYSSEKSGALEWTLLLFDYKIIFFINLIGEFIFSSG